MPGERKARADMMPEIRGGLKRAVIAMEESGKPLSTIWLQMFEEDPFNAMRLAIQCHPKEMMVGGEIEHSHRAMTDDDLRVVHEVKQKLVSVK